MPARKRVIKKSAPRVVRSRKPKEEVKKKFVDTDQEVSIVPEEDISEDVVNEKPETMKMPKPLANRHGAMPRADRPQVVVGRKHIPCIQPLGTPVPLKPGQWWKLPAKKQT